MKFIFSVVICLLASSVSQANFRLSGITPIVLGNAPVGQALNPKIKEAPAEEKDPDKILVDLLNVLRQRAHTMQYLQERLDATEKAIEDKKTREKMIEENKVARALLVQPLQEVSMIVGQAVLSREEDELPEVDAPHITFAVNDEVFIVNIGDPKKKKFVHKVIVTLKPEASGKIEKLSITHERP